MFGITELLASLGAGSQILMAGSIVMVALYVYRAVSVASTLAAIAGMVASHALVLLAAFAIVIALGWVAPNAGTVLEHAHVVWEFTTGRGLSLARRLFEAAGVLA